jgi:hypothetical protein
MLALAACGARGGLLAVELTTAPGSLVLDEVQTMRLTITEPRTVVEAQRTPGGGFDLALDLEASGVTGSLIIEGFDGNGSLVACGQSPPFAVAAINARIIVYMAPPMSVGLSPRVLSPAHAAVSAAALSYGVAVAGGVDAAGAPSDVVAVYNAYDHTLATGMPMPAPRNDMQLLGQNALLFLYGGLDPTHTATGTFLRFDTSVAPDGAYTDFGDQATLPRAGETAIAMGIDHFIVTGSPPLEIAANVVTARTDIASLPPVGANVGASDGESTAIFVGPEGIVRFRDGRFDVLSTTPRLGAAIAALPGGRVVIAGGGPSAGVLDGDAIVVDAATGAVTPRPALLATPRLRPAIAATARHLLITGGAAMDGSPVASAEVFDTANLSPLDSGDVVPRTAPFAFAMPNDQILIVGGADAIESIELFTPPPPP